MKKYSLIISLLMVAIIGFGQENRTQTIKGTVIDQQSKYPIIGATVQLVIPNKVIGTTTDIDGHFSLSNIPVGRNILRISYLGYEDALIPNILVTSGKETVLNVTLKEQVLQLNEIVVRANQDKHKPVNGMASGSVRLLSIEELQRFSGGFGDPARMAQNYAGVSGANDDRNDIIVRGNSPSGVLWKMEGVEIPAPNHWNTLGATGGPISMLNANNLSNSDFLTGAFPAEYGNATAAVFDLKLRNGNADKYEFLGQIGFNGFELGVEGPLAIGKNASFIANARYSTLGVFNALGIDFGTGSALPAYQDAVFKVNVPTEKVGTFSLWGLGGNSDISFFSNGGSIYAEGAGELNSGSETGIVGLSHLYFFNDNTSSKISLSVTTANNSTTSSEIRDSLTRIFEPNFIADYNQTKYGLNWTINKKINAKNRLKIGVNLDIYKMAIQDSFLLNSDSNQWFSETDFSGTASLAKAFAQWQHRFNDKLSMNVGLHTARFSLNNSTTIEPRFGLNYQLSPKHSFTLGISRHSQLQPLPVYFSKDRNATVAENLANEQLDFIRSNHFVVGWNYAIRPNFRVKVEGYHQQLSSLAIDDTPSSFSMINAGADFAFPNRVGLVNEGTGSNTGIELTLEKSLQKGFYFLFTSSVFDSKFTPSDGIERNTFFNSNYVANLLVGKEFKFNDKVTLMLDTKITQAGGRRYTPIDVAASIAADREVRDMTRIYEGQYAPYFRADFKIGVRVNGKKVSQLWSVDLTNLTFRRNELSKSYSRSREAISTTYQRGFFPNVTYQITF